MAELDASSIKRITDLQPLFGKLNLGSSETVVSVPNVKWEEVGGLSNVKSRLIEAVEWPLRYGHLFAQAGLRPSRGICW